MKNRFGRTTALCLVVLALTTVAARSQPSRGQAYADAYAATMVAWRDKMVKLTSQPPPPAPPGATRQQRAKLAAGQVDQLVAATADFGSRLRKLSPPKEFQGVHAATLRFFQTSVDGNRRWSRALHAGDLEKAEKVSAEAERAEAAAMKAVAGALRKAGGRPEEVQRILKALPQ